MTGTWLLPFRGRNSSYAINQNFVWRRDNVYIMDNHRAALWCWLQHLPPGQVCELMHIDWHTDTLNSAMEEWLAASPDVRNVSLDEYLAATYPAPRTGEPWTLFRWDNYLSIFLVTHADQLVRGYFATHQDGDEPLHDRLQTVPPWDLPGNISYWIDEATVPFIVNVDLDYFVYSRANHRYAPFFSQEYFEEVFGAIRDKLREGKISVLTLCLSPECVGGWPEAEALCAEACAILGIDFSLPG